MLSNSSQRRTPPSPFYYVLNPPIPPTHPPLAIYCGPSVIPSPTMNPHIRPVSPYTSPKPTSCLGRSCPWGRKQVLRGPCGPLHVTHGSMLLRPSQPTCQHSRETEKVRDFTTGAVVATFDKELLKANIKNTANIIANLILKFTVSYMVFSVDPFCQCEGSTWTRLQQILKIHCCVTKID